MLQKIDLNIFSDSTLLDTLLTFGILHQFKGFKAKGTDMSKKLHALRGGKSDARTEPMQKDVKNAS